jgi:hypothetical protein
VTASSRIQRNGSGAASLRMHPSGSASAMVPSALTEDARSGQDLRGFSGYPRSMMDQPEPSSPPDLDARLLAAVAGTEEDLERVRAVLADHERGAGPQEALQVAAEHWNQHKDVYRVASRLIAEEVRQGLLVELEGWKRQLREQLEATPAQREQARDRKRDATVKQLRAKLADAGSDLDRAEVLVDLGELYTNRHEDSTAEKHLRDAEQELEPYRRRATGSGIADALIEALPGMVRGETRDLQAELAASARAAPLLERVYAGLARVVDDAEEAQDYLDRHRTLRESLAHGSQGDLDFKGKLQELAQQIGNTGPATAEDDRPPD